MSRFEFAYDAHYHGIIEDVPSWHDIQAIARRFNDPVVDAIIEDSAFDHDLNVTV